jgi:hypothetical protein
MSRIMSFAGSRRVQVALLVVGLLFSLAVPALAQERTQVYILPPTESLVTGQPVTVDVVADGVSNLYGAEIHLRFDPATVHLEDTDPQQDGVQLIPGELLDPAQGFVVANQSNNQAGTAVFAITLVNPAPPVEGSGVVARLTFVPLQPGALHFELENVKLVTRDLQTLDVSLNGLEMQVGGQAIAPQAGEGMVGESAPSTGPITSAPPTAGVPIWMLVIVALAVVSIPLVGAWFIFARETNQQPTP